MYELYQFKPMKIHFMLMKMCQALLNINIHFKCINFTNKNVSGTEGTAGSVTGWDIANADTRSPLLSNTFLNEIPNKYG